VESLALVVTLMISIILFSGPFSLILSTSRIRKTSDSLIYLIIRRFLMGSLALFGVLLSLIFIFNPIPLVLKALSLVCIGQHVWALDREYGRFISSKFRRDGNGPAGQH